MAVVLVEGESDRVALLALAHRLGADPRLLDVVVMSGVTNLRRHLLALPGEDPVVLHDAGEAAYVERTLAALGRDVPRFACDADLEDELVRALGIPRVVELITQAGDRTPWETLRHQPFHRERGEAAVMRRFFGTTSGRKAKYAEILAGALTPAQAPAPMLGALSAALGPAAPGLTTSP
jgi:hypothetical protein